jgi:hypothetical protein
MKTTITNSLPGSSRVWIYQSSRKFTAGEAATLRQKVKDFVSQWTSHKVGVVADGDLLHELFIVLMADESKVGVSGCSIDSAVHFIKALGHEYRTNLFDRWNLAYQKGNEVIGCSKEDFEKLVLSGEIADDTHVFNNLVTTKSDFETKWKIPYAQSWLKNLKAAHTSFSSIL